MDSCCPPSQGSSFLTLLGGSATGQAGSAGSMHASPAETQSVAHREAGSNDLSVDPRLPDLEEVTITGTHLRGEQPIGDHLISLGRDELNSSGAATVPDFLRTLPQAFGGGPSEDTHFFSEETHTNSGQGAGINLRGLGARATLVLIDGKRLAPSGSEAEFADIENIPLSAHSTRSQTARTPIRRRSNPRAREAGSTRTRNSGQLTLRRTVRSRHSRVARSSLRWVPIIATRFSRRSHPPRPSVP
jgi:TonB-dependent Receptor Plug Domain